MFSGRVERVTATRIFARADAGWQHLVYAMQLETPAETAMVLPLPVVPGGGTADLEFVSLEHYPSLFVDLSHAFPHDDVDLERTVPLAAGAPIAVHSVGAFDASYVPTLADFARLDERFRLPGDVWQALPGYADHGFAVFKLKPGAARVHPMALRFRTREPDSLFFPTVHVHDGRVEAWAGFDHTLYAQGRLAPNRDWQASLDPLGKHLRKDAKGLVLADEYGYRRQLIGRYENRDVRLALG